MFKKIIKLFDESIHEIFLEANVNNQHTIIKIKTLYPLVIKLKMQKSNKQILQVIKKKLNSKGYVQELKSLIVCHYLIKNVNDSELINTLTNRNSKKQKIQGQNQKLKTKKQSLQSYVESFIIHNFQQYLVKLCLNYQSFTYCQDFDPSEETNTLTIVNHGFQTLNLMNIILQTQQSFAKMGRFYINHLEIVSLYLAYLEDLKIYNQFIKLAVNYLVKRTKRFEKQQLKHVFLFINESIKTSDRLYQYFYLRYYHYIIRELFHFPTFLDVNQMDFQQVESHVKKIDRQLIDLVKMSTNPNPQKRRYRTEPPIEQSLPFQCTDNGLLNYSTQKNEANSKTTVNIIKKISMFIQE